MGNEAAPMLDPEDFENKVEADLAVHSGAVNLGERTTKIARNGGEGEVDGGEGVGLLACAGLLRGRGSSGLEVFGTSRGPGGPVVDLTSPATPFGTSRWLGSGVAGVSRGA